MSETITNPVQHMRDRAGTADPSTLPHSCRCGARWSGSTTSHCGAGRSVALPLAIWDCDPGFLAQRYPELHERSVDTGRIPSKPFADLVGAKSVNVKTGSLCVPGFDDDLALVVGRNSSGSCSEPMVHNCVLRSGQWSQILWAVVGLVAVDVVHVLFDGDPTVVDSVLIGFDVLPRPNVPSQQHVTMPSDVPTRLVRRDLLPGSKRSNKALTVADGSTGSATTSLTGASDGGSTIDADDSGHGLILQVTALCHQTFSGVSTFDAHRRNGRCLTPAEVGMSLVPGRPYECWGYPGGEATDGD